MENKRFSKEDMIRLKAWFTQKYGIELDEWFAAVMNEMNELNQSARLEVSKVATEIKNTAALIKGQIKSVHFNDNKQAFYFGLGVFLPFAVPILFAVLLVGYYQITDQEFQQKRDFVNEYPNSEELGLFLQNVNIESKGGNRYISLKVIKDRKNIQIGHHYEFDTKNNRVLVPIEIN